MGRFFTSPRNNGGSEGQIDLLAPCSSWNAPECAWPITIIVNKYKPREKQSSSVHMFFIKQKPKKKHIENSRRQESLKGNIYTDDYTVKRNDQNESDWI